ncbi:NAD(P)/FAD-dependent oxidoreductase [Bacillus sp. FJAT-29814]|uniref:FAD-dependent oxidoreductase n=1 Tax=Bacillus sp. FJAT-29814 TaxID=1729688 RepID=UPI000A95B988|nr:FAD-dependent monooxygenase [Bacillus sp. FJAT-29814]
MENPIIIVGAGPVGLTAAEILTSQGIPVLVIEKNDSPNKEWRASTFHPGTMELLETTGLTEELLKRGLKAPVIQYRDRQTGLYAEFDATLISDETKYPFRLQCPQSTYTQVVYERLQKRTNTKVLFNSEVVQFTQDPNGVSVTVQTFGVEQTFRTPFLLGADGARSSIRKLLGLSFEGYTLEERFLLSGTPKSFEPYLPDLAYVNYISDPDEFLFILRVPEAWRLLYPIPPSVSDEEALSDESIQAGFKRALKTEDEFPIVERMIYRVHQRVAEKFHQGRVVLMGDAAHINSPLGGLGLNSGIHDAVDLSRRLIRIFSNQPQATIEEELEVYSNVRRQVALAYVRQITERNTQLMKEKDSEYRLKMQQELAKEAADPELARKWLLRAALISAVREQGIGEPPKAKQNH